MIGCEAGAANEAAQGSGSYFTMQRIAKCFARLLWS